MSSAEYSCKLFKPIFCIQANSVDPDQTAPKGAVWSGSTLFAKMTFKITSRWQSRLQLLWLAVWRLTSMLSVVKEQWFNFHVCQISTISSEFSAQIQHITNQNLQHLFLIYEEWFTDTSTVVGHFVSSPREREKRDRRDSRDEREGQGRKRKGMKVKNLK